MTQPLSSTYEMASDYFPPMQYLSGNAPSDYISSLDSICPVISMSSTTNNNPNLRFYRTDSYDGTAERRSSDSEDSLGGNNNDFADTSVHFPSTISTFSTSPSHHGLSISPPPKSPLRPPSRPYRRIPHAAVERRYRDNLNTSIETLRLTLPSLKDACNTTVGPSDHEDAALASRGPSKAVIISTATAYIKELQREQRKAESQIEQLKEQMADLQNLLQCNHRSVLQLLQRVGDGYGGVQAENLSSACT
ncbi:unnamed protein product [Zymoseptoria tritici ST99CH_1A5]|uniref:BHLH domain-containing protein n=1 Tax=Zymoseptoria tritici ST99CH_1A5 TaxID=1276529 RepID=A0A1Y6L610_ZYMTR|nr:unnamed protein product [Zymoseptoria tritici ST99CH_3D1]SMY19886.1 unnamed protein product [Zymoseptoria tritici ST99CH_1A5]